MNPMETNASPVSQIRTAPACMIRTRFLGPTDHKPARVVAEFLADKRTRATVSWDYSQGGSEGHIPAVLALVVKANMQRAEWGWPRIDVLSLLSCGEDGGGYVWCVVESKEVSK
jgi:hypothetical protein